MEKQPTISATIFKEFKETFSEFYRKAFLLDVHFAKSFPESLITAFNKPYNINLTDQDIKNKIRNLTHNSSSENLNIELLARCQGTWFNVQFSSSQHDKQTTISFTPCQKPWEKKFESITTISNSSDIFSLDTIRYARLLLNLTEPSVITKFQILPNPHFLRKLEDAFQFSALVHPEMHVKDMLKNLLDNLIHSDCTIISNLNNQKFFYRRDLREFLESKLKELSSYTIILRKNIKEYKVIIKPNQISIIPCNDLPLQKKKVIDRIDLKLMFDLCENIIVESLTTNLEI